MGIKTQCRAQGEQRFQLVAARGHLVLCILGPPPVAPAPGSSQHCWHCSKANEAGLQLWVQGKEKTSRVLRKIKSRRLDLFYSRMILVQPLQDAGGMAETRREGHVLK